ncbi:MAG: VCBS repeat-containing protein, partial [Anaerolineae bacterium]|nr:VCBS repeat-containing protein [Anaerolineae bacterium]
VDGDGDLDWVAGNASQPNQLYLNQGVLQGGAVGDFAPGWTSPDSRATRSVAWGDVDRDGDLDLAVANENQPNQLFLNDGAGGFSLAWESADARPTRAVAWGDTDGDGDLDLIAGNYADVNQVYENQNGRLGSSPAWQSPPGEMRRTTGVAVRDVNGDGRLDVVVGNDGQSNQVYVNRGSHAFSIHDVGTDAYTTQAVALGDADGDGDLDMAVANFGQVDQVYENVWTGRAFYADNPFLLRILGPQNALQADLYATAEVLSDPLIPITYRLVDGESDRVGRVEAFYSTDGGGQWLPAVAASSTVTSNLAADPLGVTHVYTWDTFASGFFGQSDDVVLRLVAYPQPVSSVISGTYVYSGTAPFPNQHPYVATTSFPFRARGTQVRVYSGAATPGNAVSAATVYRLPAGQSTGGALLADDAGLPFRTDGNGYLQGRGTIAISDTLVAMVPITHTDVYTLYYTSGAVTEAGLLGHQVTTPGVQDLVVSADSPLILFNLDVSLEWDAHNDSLYLDELAFNLQRTSEYLYDFTNGQIALGQVDVFQNADEWAYAHVVVNANNRLRPFAAQGGVVLTDTVDPQHNVISDTIVYAPGQVAMGSTWNRYGTPGQSLGEDWAIILAHELSHYLLFQDDTYIGMDENGYLVAVDSCAGSAMGDLYSNPDNTEFVAADAAWATGCTNTLANQTLGRDEWETIGLWYPDLMPPSTINPGPSLMSLDLTMIHVHDPYTLTNTLVDPSFYIDYDGGGGASSEARAYLLRDEYTINLGSPFGGQNRIIARGAQPGDRLCVFDRSRGQFGCETIVPGDDRLAMERDTTWNPIVQVRPVNSTTVGIAITNTVPITPLKARLFPDLGYGEEPIDLSLENGIYTGTFHLTWPAMSGNVQIWVDEAFTEADPRREAVIPYAIGGNPGTLRAGGGTLRAGGGTLRAGGGTLRAGGGTLRAGGAPIVSPDGQMIFFTENPIDFEPGTFFTIQAMAGLPPLPAGRTLVGQGYNLVASPGVTLPQGSVSMQYLPNDVLVAGASESHLELYYWDELTGWQPLQTVLDAYYNLASAPSQGEGFYALLASVRIPLFGPGWNNFSYPIEGTRPVTEALLSVSGFYTTVYHYDATDWTDPWAVYDVTVPDWVNDLETLTFGQGYWINVSESIVLYMAPGTTESLARSAPFVPVPATFYGAIAAGPSFTPSAGMTVLAWSGGEV